MPIRLLLSRHGPRWAGEGKVREGEVSTLEGSEQHGHISMENKGAHVRVPAQAFFLAGCISLWFVGCIPGGF